jgi:hypothetical protein
MSIPPVPSRVAAEGGARRTRTGTRNGQERRGCSEGVRCKAPDDADAEAYELYAAGRREEGNAPDDPFRAAVTAR